MDDPREQDEFERIRLHGEIERSEEIIDHYWRGVTYYRNEIRKAAHQIGKIDQRLEDAA